MEDSMEKKEKRGGYREGGGRPKGRTRFYVQFRLRCYESEWESILLQSATSGKTYSRWIADRVNASTASKSLEEIPRGTAGVVSKNICILPQELENYKAQAESEGMNTQRWIISRCL